MSKAILPQDMERRKKLKQETRQTVFRQTKEEFEQLKNDAYEHKMNISDYLRYLVAKERKLIEPYVPATSSSEKWFNAMLEQAKKRQD